MAISTIPEDVNTMMTALVEYFEKQCEGEEYSEGLYRDLYGQAMSLLGGGLGRI